MKKRAIIFGVNGQDGSYLSELLLSKGYDVVGVHRRSSVDILERVKDIGGLRLVEGDITDFNSVQTILKEYYAEEIYNLAAQSHVGTSFKQPILTTEVNYIGVLNILEAIRNDTHLRQCSRFYQASTSEMFGANYTSINNGTGCSSEHWVKFQDEDTPFAPRSPYAVAKLAAHHAVNTYRASYGLHASSGILFNHESPRRGEHFVTRKITKWLANFINSPCYRNGSFNTDAQDVISGLYGTTFPKLRLGNIDAYRDWGHAQDYVNAMWLMLQQEEPDDYVVATGETYAVRDFLKEAFSIYGISDWENYIVIDPEFYRPAEVEYLRGSPKKAESVLGWKRNIDFHHLVADMVNSDLRKY